MWGAGTDFLQWVKGKAKAYGLDLTPEAIAHVEKRLSLNQLTCEDLRVGDCEQLPYRDNYFDVVYSWGVIHHTPDTDLAFREVVRVLKSKGVCKIMVYHRKSVYALYHWFKKCFFRCQPWKSISYAMDRHMESPGTKAFSVSEIRNKLSKYPVENILIDSSLTYYDLPLKDKGWKCRYLLRFSKIIAWTLGWRQPGWFMRIEFTKREVS